VLIDEVIPRWDVRTRRAIRVVAPAPQVWRALDETTLGEMPVARLLFRLRGLPSDRNGAILGLEGFREVGEDPGRERVVGAVGRPWRIFEPLVADADPRTFRAPGYAVMALNVGYADGVLSTETRVRCTDRRSRLLFRLYWLAVGPFSRLVRDDWLRAVSRRVAS
jgi:hypothetical protein